MQQLSQLHQQLQLSQAKSEKLTEQLQAMQHQAQRAAAAQAAAEAARAAAVEGRMTAEKCAAEAGRKLAAADDAIVELRQRQQQQLQAHLAEVNALKVCIDAHVNFLRRAAFLRLKSKLPPATASYLIIHYVILQKFRSNRSYLLNFSALNC